MFDRWLSTVSSRFGFVPNGGRTYYMNRSQPPLLTPMVDLYFQETSSKEFLVKNLPLLRKENEFWLKRRSVDVSFNGETYRMARYCADLHTPRPEGYAEDVQLAAGLSGFSSDSLRIVGENPVVWGRC
jgi:alpha,alpha-trehalase